LGYQALNSNSGTNNVAIGYQSLQANTTASNNTAVGYQALYSQQTHGSNTAFGYQAGYTNNSDSNNTYLGFQAGYANTGNNNTFVGYGSGVNMTSGSANTIIGEFSGNQNGLNITTSSNNIVLSDGAGNIQLYVNSLGARGYGGGYTGEAVFAWGNVSSFTQDIQALFANFAGISSAGWCLTLQIVTQTGNNASSALIMANKTSGNSWSFSQISFLTGGGATSSVSTSGSGTSLTLTFSQGGQFGHCKVSIVMQT
jgi:hypothetical protein